MNDPAESTKRAAAAAPPRPRGSGALFFLGVLAALYTGWAARELLVPFTLAMFLAVVGNPVVSRLRRLWVPRWLGALAVVIGGLAAALLLASVLVTPAGQWLREAPEGLRQFAPQLRELVRQVDEANKAAESIAQAAGAPSPRGNVQIVQDRRPSLWTLLADAPRTLAGALAVVLLSYFFLVYGEALQRKAIALLPGRHQKRLTVEILTGIESEISRYVVTISLINTALGALIAGALWRLGLEPQDALLWGTVAALLNFAPYIGPLLGVFALGLVGVVAFDDPAKMFLPAAVYLGLHTLESQLITPIVLGRRMAVSPLVLLLWLMLWGWLWGIAGLLLAVPMLVCFKIVAGKVEGWQGWARVIE